jgi:hypothetical protein
VLAAAVLVAVTAVSTRAQTDPPRRPAEVAPLRGPGAFEQAGAWKLETLTLKSGRVLEGLVRGQRADEIDFVEVVRPAGKPLYLVAMSFDPQSVQSVARLAADDRKLLLERIGPLLTVKSRARIEAARMEDIALKEIVRDEVRHFIYREPAFTLESTADEESTRRCTVRIEQIFRAFQRVLPPGDVRRSDLRVVLFGSMDQYRAHLAARGLGLENPAYYSPVSNTIAAGSDLDRYTERLAQVRAENEELRRQYEQRNRDFNRQLVGLASQMRASGFSRQEIETEQRIRRAAWEREYKALLGEDGDGGLLAQINRRNAARFEELAGQMFRRLYHEAFHAYLENHVFPAASHEVPRWLNEGLAQIFEQGQLEADTLRIDAPDRATLEALQAELSGGQPLSLAEILSADEQAFLVTHGDAHASRRHYLYSWGLAWYLAFEQDLLAGEKFAGYVARDNVARSPLVRFELLVGKPLPKFEQEWRRAMLELKP